MLPTSSFVSEACTALMVNNLMPLPHLKHISTNLTDMAPPGKKLHFTTHRATIPRIALKKPGLLNAIKMLWVYDVDMTQNESLLILQILLQGCQEGQKNLLRKFCLQTDYHIIQQILSSKELNPFKNNKTDLIVPRIFDHH